MTARRPDIVPIPPPQIHAPEDTIEAALRRLSAGPPDERVRLGELVASLDARAYGIVLLLCAVPNLTPGPSIPGFSTVFGLPAMAFGVQMLMGRVQPHLPGALARVRFKRGRLARLLAHALPLVRRIDRLLRPRMTALTRASARPWTGMSCLLLGALLALPLPLFSIAPAFGLLLVAVGLIARDGLVLICGHAVGVGTLGLAAGLAVAARRFLGW